MRNEDGTVDAVELQPVMSMALMISVIAAARWVICVAFGMRTFPGENSPE